MFIFQCDRSHYNEVVGERVKEENSKYRLIKKIDEDSRTRTYKAEDLVLKRRVTFVQLKRGASDRDDRQFLLQARLMGQLKHPGILPLHDMGLHDERYFYSQRVPPGMPLSKLISLHNTGSKSPLRPRSRQILYILSQITDAIAHLHSELVTLGRLYTDSVYVGDFGEVVIKDLSKAQKFSDPKSEAFTKSKSDDLQNLAH
jgi:serine/threonine-protein kinase